MYEPATLAAIALVVAYSFYKQSLGVTLAAVGLGTIVYAVSKSLLGALAILSAVVFMRDANSLLFGKREPMGLIEEGATVGAPLEGFQARDPVSIHKRINDVKQTVPLAPKVQGVTGVLESANILDNHPLQGMQELANEGVPGASIPASAKARVLIYPPSENSVPARKESFYAAPKDNPYLQNGQDRLAEEVAHAQRGTDIHTEENSGNLEGVATGAGPAF
jgi:hypothetical protein